MDEESQKNNDLVAASWYPIRAALEKYDGVQAMNLLAAARENSLGTWNGCYWKVNGWFEDWFRAKAPLDDHFPMDDFGSDDFVRFILKLYPTKKMATWDTDDLPHMCHELRSAYGVSAGR